MMTPHFRDFKSMFARTILALSHLDLTKVVAPAAPAWPVGIWLQAPVKRDVLWSVSLCLVSQGPADSWDHFIRIRSPQKGYMGYSVGQNELISRMTKLFTIRKMDQPICESFDPARSHGWFCKQTVIKNALGQHYYSTSSDCYGHVQSKRSTQD